MCAIKLIDLDQEIFVPLYDEAQDMTYEQIMTIGDMLDKFMGGYQPPVVDAIPVEWLEEHDGENISDTDGNIYGRRHKTIPEALSMWQKEQEVR